MKEFWINNKEKIITIILCGSVFIVILSIIALVSGSIMRLFGFQYESLWSIILFFIIAAVISFPLNLIAESFPNSLFMEKRISKNYAIVLYLVIDTIATALGLTIVDYYMSSVSASTISIIVISFLLALPGKDDFKDI